MTTNTDNRLGLSFLDGKKERHEGAPWFVLISDDGRRRNEVVKTWQPGNEGKQYGRWMCRVDLGIFENGLSGPGDTYIWDVIRNASHLVEVDGREPTTEELAEWAQFVSDYTNTVPKPDF